MKRLFDVTLFFLVILAELLLGNLALPPLLLTGFLMVYLCFSASPVTAVAAALGGGFLLDLIYNRAVPLSAPLLLAALGVLLLVRRTPPPQAFELALPGLAVALTILPGTSLVRLMTGSTLDTPAELFWRLLFFGAFSMIFYPAATILLDAVARGLGLPGAVRESKASFNRLRPRRITEPRPGPGGRS